MASLLDKNDKRPLYTQLSERLKSELRDFPIGDKFYADRELVRKYSVSPHVVRQALSLLVEDGYIERLVSKGTYVRKHEREPLPTDTRRIAIFFPIAAKAFPHIGAVMGITEVLEDEGYTAEIHDNFKSNKSMEALIVDRLRQVDGIIWISPISDEIFEMPESLRISVGRLVFLNIYIHEPGFTCVNRDDASATFGMTSHLIQQGRKKIAFIGGPQDRRISRDRYEGYKRALTARGMDIPPSLTARHEGSPDDIIGGYHTMETILERGETPDAVVCLTDHLAIGAVNCLTARGLSVPGDVAVTGFDNNEFIRAHMRPELTSAELPFYEEGRQAVRLLLSQLLEKQPPGVRQMVPCQLFFRESSEKWLR